MGKRSWLGARIAAALLQLAGVQAQAAEPASTGLASIVVQASGTADASGFDGVVEAVRQTVLAAQVQGSVQSLPVKAGDLVKEGQVLVRIDARAATQDSVASQAQVLAARAALEVADKDYQRQRQLFARAYISQAALERAEAQFRANAAQLKAQIAQASATTIHSDFYIVKAPYAGVIAELPITVGDMAMPGRPLLTLYDPGALRVTAAVPQTALTRFAAEQPARVELPGQPPAQQWLPPAQVQVLPTMDAGTHSTQVRVDLPRGLKGVTPGVFARLWLPARTGTALEAHLYVPLSAIVRRAELTVLYVIGADGAPQLRQVRPGRARNDSIEILSGVSAGERVALDPQAAAREPRR